MLMWHFEQVFNCAIMLPPFIQYIYMYICTVYVYMGGALIEYVEKKGHKVT